MPRVFQGQQGTEGSVGRASRFGWRPKILPVLWLLLGMKRETLGGSGAGRELCSDLGRQASLPLELGQ